MRTPTSAVRRRLRVLEELQALDAAGGIIGAPTVHTVNAGQVYQQRSTDTLIIFNTVGGTATLNMIAGVKLGQEVTLKWFSYDAPPAAPVKPTVNAEPGTNLMEQFGGMDASGVAGLHAEGNFNTPGASWLLKWSGTYWLRAS